MSLKTSIVTGATSGLGFATAKALAAKGHEVILVARSQQKGEIALDKIHQESPNAQLHLITADLSQQASIRKLATQIEQQFPKIDVLVNNAGIWNTDRIITVDGIEEVFAVNHLSYYLLTHLLYPLLRLSKEGRVVNVGSDSHFQWKRINLDDVSLESKYHGLRSYAQSKLANLLFTYEFHRLKPDQHIHINCVQPGLVKTDIGVKHTNWLHSLAWKIRRSGGVSPEEGAATQVFLASAPEASGKSGLYWDKCKPKSSSEGSYHEEDARQLWAMSCEWCGISSYFPA
ncbi:MAG TPA: SDR family NAD(P)-dependent oxidoreductase [Saprospiraceae bacterium]|nr:SDR family NAD(P)-dependent oxidoreductase [Saprospiraceae bacterium]HMQ82723.1 SDR family NAD(P)-dependent oxidoreductase [Saprospiraceae bacterium]